MSNDSEEDEDREEDTFDQLRDLAVEQMANVAQLTAEARRLGLIPELPRELVEKLDLGGMLLDLVRLQLKHATAVASVIGPQGRNLEKLNHLSALLAKGKSGTPTEVYGKKNGAETIFQIVLDNPVDRPQKVKVSLGNLHQLDAEKDEATPFWEKPGEEGDDDPKESLAWYLKPRIEQVDAREVRSLRIVIPAKSLPKRGDYEVTATVGLSPLGTYRRYQLRPPKTKSKG